MNNFQQTFAHFQYPLHARTQILSLPPVALHHCFYSYGKGRQPKVYYRAILMAIIKSLILILPGQMA